MNEIEQIETSILTSLTSRELAEYILKQSAKINQAEKEMASATRALEIKGTTIEEQLDLMRDENKTTNT